MRTRLPPTPTGAAEPDAVREALADELEHYPVDNPTLCDLLVRAAASLRFAPAVGVTREAIQEACDLLAERKYGNPARSAGHNARLALEAALRLPALSPSGHGEEHTARFLARLVCTRGVAYGAYLESADAWVDANWRFFLGDARRLGSIVPAVGVTREAIARIVDPEAFEIDGVRSPLSLWKTRYEIARNKADAILALPSPVPDATVSGGELTPVQLSVINDMTHAWIDDPAQHRIAFRNDCKRLLASSSQDVGREATIDECKAMALAQRSPPGGPWIERIAFFNLACEAIADKISALSRNGGGRG